MNRKAEPSGFNDSDSWGGDLKRFRWLLVGVFFLALIGCSALQPIGGSTFSRGVAATANSDALSWWYLGETDDYYIVTRKSEEKVATFRVDKSQVTITGFDPFRPWMKEPVRLKRENITLKE